MSKSEELFKKAQNLMPGGVNSPVRAFNAVNRHPFFVDRAQGAYLYDVDGKFVLKVLHLEHLQKKKLY